MTPAVRELESAGIEFTLHDYEHRDGRRDFGREAADELGIDPDRVFKTLLVTVDGGQVVAIVPVSGSAALKAVGRAFGSKRAEMCDPLVAERVTGYVVGGISPFGQKKRLPTVIDEIALAFETIFVSGGRRGLDLEITPENLVRHLDAVVADIAIG
jgi:Cys-tRNA(Pro)/Cys-tRNA(Cys) deacylase